MTGPTCARQAAEGKNAMHASELGMIYGRCRPASAIALPTFLA